MKFQKTLMAVASAAMAFGPVAGIMPVCASNSVNDEPVN